jgi:SAM-dependent methyltransferase
MNTSSDAKLLWEGSFAEQIARDAYNTAPVEALVRNISYYLRQRDAGPRESLHFLEMGCGAGPNLLWLAQKGITVSGVDIASNALDLARHRLDRAGYVANIGSLSECSVADTPFEDESFDGILEACVFQHLDKETRIAAFAEVSRLLKPGGLFVGYMLARGHSTYQAKASQTRADDEGTLHLADGTSKIHLTNIGLAHFFAEDEFERVLPGFTVIDPCLTTYYLPRDEARRRGYDTYLQSMWALYAIK